MNANQEPHSLRETLIGAWELVSCTEIDFETKEVYLPMGETPVGFILYTPDGYMSAQLSAPDDHPCRDNQECIGRQWRH